MSKRKYKLSCYISICHHSSNGPVFEKTKQHLYIDVLRIANFFSPRLSLELLVLSGVIVSSLASIWAVQTLSWWFDRLPSTCGRSWSPTPPGLFERSSQPSSLSCWASWLPPALTRERYFILFIFCKHTVFYVPRLATVSSICFF